MQNIRELLFKKQVSKEDRDLQLALAMSAKEQVNEQKKLLEQFAKKATTTPVRKKRTIKPERQSSEDDAWFQTVSTRPQIKKESEPFQFDMDSIFGDEAQMDSDSDSSIIDLVNTPEVKVQPTGAHQVEAHQVEAHSGAQVIEDDEDEGYLSPLEGFTRLADATTNPFLEQLQPKPKRKRATSATNTTKAKKYKRKWTRKRKR